MTTLTEYPKLIFEAANLLNRKEWSLMKAKQKLAVAENRADMTVAFGEFKNDNQRKAARLDLLQQDQEYINRLDEVNDLTGARADALADLERLRNEFSVAKIEARTRIADRLVGIDNQDLVDA